MNAKTPPICLVPNCGAEAHRRGLCGTHYNSFIASTREMTDEKRAEYEAMLIEKKLLKPSKKPGPMANPNVFRDLAAPFKKTPEQQAAERQYRKVKRKVSKKDTP